MNFRPLVSLVCPTYGRPQLIPFAVQFFLSQTWTRSELIIIDDSPRDLQCKIRESGRIRVVRLKDRLSLGEKHNLGHDLAQGDILGYQDDDDIWGHHRLARQLQPIVLGECSIVGMLRDVVFKIPSRTFWRFNLTKLPVKSWIGNGRATFRLQIHDGTALYHRRVLRHGLKHPPLAIGQKVEFLNGVVAAGERWRAVPNGGDFVYVRHQRTNTWQFREDLRLVEIRRPWWFPEALMDSYRGIA